MELSSGCKICSTEWFADPVDYKTEPDLDPGWGLVIYI